MMTSPAQQRKRRLRILSVTLGIARTRGYDGVQMRAVAERADVATTTLYRYFPSKTNLLMSVLDRELDRVERNARSSAPETPDGYTHLWQITARLNGDIARHPRLAEAMSRAFMVAYIAESSEADQTRRRLDAMFARLLCDGEPSTRQSQMASIIVDAWASNVLSWLSHRATTRDINQRMWHLLDMLARSAGVRIQP